MTRISDPPQAVPPSTHAFKYRLAYVVGGECVLRYDNERGKGDHRHAGRLTARYREPRGLFATRAPKRTNPIGLSVVQLDKIDDGVLQVQNVDILDGTPLLDIKPYVPELDAQVKVRTGWLETASKTVSDRKSDDRFK
jgi:tRNA (Thr-GGU) A37 N-methylase